MRRRLPYCCGFWYVVALATLSICFTVDAWAWRSGEVFRLSQGVNQTYTFCVDEVSTCRVRVSLGDPVNGHVHMTVLGPNVNEFACLGGAGGWSPAIRSSFERDYDVNVADIQLQRTWTVLLEPAGSPSTRPYPCSVSVVHSCNDPGDEVWIPPWLPCLQIVLTNSLHDSVGVTGDASLSRSHVDFSGHLDFGEDSDYANRLRRGLPTGSTHPEFRAATPDEVADSALYEKYVRAENLHDLQELNTFLSRQIDLLECFKNSYDDVKSSDRSRKRSLSMIDRKLKGARKLASRVERSIRELETGEN